MNDEQINATIAKLCGLEVQPQDSFGFKGFNHIPDYCADLNAMHEAENILRDANLLLEYGMHISNWHRYEYLLRATARQRAEAFLKTLGKWEEAVVKESFTTDKIK